METPDTVSAKAVLDFWFSAEVEKDWFNVNPGLDQAIREKFGGLHQLATEGKLASWQESADTALAFVILLDQFSRNMFRGTPRAFASDALARQASRTALASCFDQERPERERNFFYLPLMHSENLSDQVDCVELHRRLEDRKNLEYAIEHRDIIARFGRFPHRNEILGRASSDEEKAFLKDHKGF